MLSKLISRGGMHEINQIKYQKVKTISTLCFTAAFCTCFGRKPFFFLGQDFGLMLNHINSLVKCSYLRFLDGHILVYEQSMILM